MWRTGERRGRDNEGRLVWGVNDFDHSALLPYTYDLLRLATSAQLSGQVSGSPKDQVATILNGYNDGLSKPGPGSIDVDVPWMADLARHLAPVPRRFKKKLENPQKPRTLRLKSPKRYWINSPRERS